jgi:ribulose-phosphate 3-epimerase
LIDEADDILSSAFLLPLQRLKSTRIMVRIIAPSLLSADFLNLGSEIEMINNSSAQWIHCDIMDGHFVPNLTFGFPLLRQIRVKTNKLMDVHLMITNAEQYIDEYIAAGADVLTLHWEATTHLHRALSQIKDKGAKAGISLNPHSPVGVLESILPYADMILLMSVNPGFGGQSFIPSTYDKIRILKDLCQKHNPSCMIQIDGGVTRNNAGALFSAGANVLVAGNAVFSSKDPVNEIDAILYA